MDLNKLANSIATSLRYQARNVTIIIRDKEAFIDALPPGRDDDPDGLFADFSKIEITVKLK